MSQVLKARSSHNQECLELFGKTVRAARMAAKMSQIDLATDTGIDHSTVGRIERGQVNVSLGVALEIFWHLDLSHDDIMSFLRQDAQLRLGAA